MEKFVYYSPDGEFLIKSKLDVNQYTVYFGSKLNDVLIYMINNPDTMLFLYDLNSDNEVNKKVMEGIYQLNALLPFIGVATENELVDEDRNIAFNRNYQTIRPLDDFNETLQSVQKNRRQYNRTEWPLSATFYLERDPKHSESGIVLSLSAGGAYVKTTNLGLVGDSKLLMEIKFKDFKFFVEAYPIRVNRETIQGTSPGFAVEFANVSHATQKYIKSIINDRILSGLLDALNLSHQS